KSNAVQSFELELDWTAQTILPIEFKGQELQLEARAYQGADPNFQALALIHRTKNGADHVPVVRVHSGCVTGDIFHSLRCDGYPEIKLMTNNPAKVEALRGEGVDVIEQLPLIVKESAHNKRYLATKKERMAHKL